MKHEQYRTLHEDLAILLEKTQSTAELSLKEILEILSEKGSALALIFLSLPFCQPIQIPGFSTPFGIIVAAIGIQMAFGKPLWLPKRILQKNISATTIQKIVQKTILAINKINRLSHSRMIWICDHGAMQVTNGLLISFLGVFLALPLPIPLTNLVAGWAIFLVSIGLLNDDGVFVLIGYLASLAILIFFVVILFSLKNFF